MKLWKIFGIMEIFNLVDWLITYFGLILKDNYFEANPLMSILIPLLLFFC